jgi:hypothetical protein
MFAQTMLAQTRIMPTAAAILMLAGSAYAQDALVWENESSGQETDIALRAAQALNLDIVLIDGNDQATFRGQLASGGWEVVVINNPLNVIQTETIDALGDWVAAGGRLHVSYWRADTEPALGPILGFESASDLNSPRQLRDTADSSWAGVGNLEPGEDVYADNGDTLQLRAGFRAGLRTDSASIVTAVSDHVVFNAWDYASMADHQAVQLGVQKQLEHLLGASAGAGKVLVATTSREDLRHDVDALSNVLGVGGYDLITRGDGLADRLAASGYDAVFAHDPGGLLNTQAQVALAGFVDADGIAQLSYFNLDNSAVLRDAFGVASATDILSPRPVFRVGIHPMWGDFAGPVLVDEDRRGDNGDLLTPAPVLAQIASRFDSFGGPGATVIANASRTIVNGFEYESMQGASVRTLLENQAFFLLDGERCDEGLGFDGFVPGQRLTDPVEGVRFTLGDGRAAAVSNDISEFDGLALTNTADGGLDRVRTLVIEFPRPVTAIELDFNSVAEPLNNPVFPVKLFAGDELVGTRGFIQNARAWRRDITLGGLPGVTRIEISAPQENWIFGIDNICFDLVACRVDLDGDGELNIFDFLSFQNAFDLGDSTADFDGDGSLTIFDFLAFQNEFDAGCE